MNVRFSLVVFSTLLWVLGCSLPLMAAEPARVFLVASYSENHVCGAPQESGVLDGLRRQGWIEGHNLVVERYYMETKKHYTTPAAMCQRGEDALRKIHDFAPDLVVTLDDNAFREVGLKLAPSKIPVVFSGMNGQPEAYNSKQKFMVSREKPGGMVTGVYEKLHVVRSLKVMAAAVPGVTGHKVVGITDFSPTGNAISKQFAVEIPGDSVAGIGWEQRRVKDWDAYRALIDELNKNPEVAVIYPVALSLQSTERGTLTAPEIFAWTMEHSLKPEMALNYFFAKIGLFGGAAVDFAKMGAVAGSKGGKILHGAKPGDLAIVDAPDYAIVFNVSRARALGVEIPTPLLTAADHVYR